VFVITYFANTNDIKTIPTLVYAIASFSDFLDGYLARKYEASSKIGLFLDPFADKLMTTAVMVCIAMDGIIPYWTVLVVVGKEILMAIGGFIMHKAASAELMPANMLGKTATVVFFLVCVTLMLFRNITKTAATAMISFAILLTIISLASYLKKYIVIMKNKNNDKSVCENIP
jgi:CDP-diacylglycerol--glycerol-3-phosphate 3-phosphatidyltransferase